MTESRRTFLFSLAGIALATAGMLLARGHSSERVERILGQNALRVMREVWGV